MMQGPIGGRWSHKKCPPSTASRLTGLRFSAYTKRVKLQADFTNEVLPVVLLRAFYLKYSHIQVTK